jgi:hypothetical protein
MNGTPRPPKLEWKEEFETYTTYTEKIIEWVKQPPYRKRELRGELAYLKAHIEYSKKLSNHYQCRRNHLNTLLGLSYFFLTRAESAFKRSDYLEFHQNITHADRVLFYHLLLYEEVTGRTPNWLDLKRISLRHVALNKSMDFSYREKKMMERLGSESELSKEEWIEIYLMIHDKGIEEHEKERINQAKSNRHIRQLAITTFLTFGTVLIVILGVSGQYDIPILGPAEPPPILVNNSANITFSALFGLFGAIVSDLSKYSDDGGSRANEHGSAIRGVWATSAKYVFGATSAVIIIIILYSGFLPAINTNELTSGLVLVISFAAGFSERIVRRALEEVSF